MDPQMQEYFRQARANLGSSEPYKSDQWLRQLAGLDVTSEAAVYDFLMKTYVGNTELIPVGAHKGVSYFIETAKDQIPTRGNISLTPLESMRGSSDYVKSYEFDLLPDGGGPRPDFRYGFGVGRLVYIPDKNSYAKDAGFFVVFNIVDKSLWIAVNMQPFRNADTEFRRTPLPPTWGLLPEDYEKQIGLMRISQPECKSILRPDSLIKTNLNRVEKKPPSCSEWRPLWDISFIRLGTSIKACGV